MMMKMRASKWLPWALLGAGLPGLAAYSVTTESLFSDIKTRVEAALGAGESAKWAKVGLDGRDVTITGTSPSREAVDEAVKAVSAVYGVRKVISTAQIVAASQPVATSSAAMTVVSAIVNTATPTIIGTWPEAQAAGLSVKLGDKLYALKSNPELTSDGAGNWQLIPSAQLAEGTYDVIATIKDANGNETVGAAPGKIVIDLTAPAAPVVAPPAAGAKWPYAITGTWPESDAKSLAVKLDGREYVLNRGAALTSDGKGNFTFTPLAKLAPGDYDIDFTVQDAAGNATQFVAQKAIVVTAAAEPPATASGPTVEKMLDLTGAPVIKGTWVNSKDTALSVTVGGRTYTLGADANLSTDDAGHWKLLPAKSLADGIYDVVAEMKAPSGEVTRDATVAELEVDGIPPAAPVVTAYTGDSSPPAITGTWDEKSAAILKVYMPELGLAAKLGDKSGLVTSDGGGNWSLSLAATLVPGTYNLIVKSIDRYGRIQQDATIDEIIVTAKGAKPAAAASSGFDCGGVLTQMASIFPMRFQYKSTDFAAKFGLSVDRYVSFLKDPRCAELPVEVGGHADDVGSDGYNIALSQKRAERVRELLIAAGIDAARLATRAYGESMPLDTGKTDEAKMKNRRVEITAIK